MYYATVASWRSRAERFQDPLNALPIPARRAKRDLVPDWLVRLAIGSTQTAAYPGARDAREFDHLPEEKANAGLTPATGPRRRVHRRDAATTTRTIASR